MTVLDVRIFASRAQKGVQPPNRGVETTDHEDFHMKFKRLTVLAIAALSLGAVACGGGSDSTGPTPAPQSGTIKLLNGSSATIIGVYFTKCEDSSWGQNRLASTDSLAPGALRTWTVEPGCYDLKASTGSKSATWLNRDLTPGGALQLAVPATVASTASTSRDIHASSVKSR